MLRLGTAVLSTFLVSACGMVGSVAAAGGTIDFDKAVHIYERSARSEADKRALQAAILNPSHKPSAATGKTVAPPAIGSMKAQMPGTKAVTVSSAAAPPPRLLTAGYAITPQLVTFIRHDFADLGSLSSPTPTATAQGAETSYTDDIQNHNRIWTTQALAAAVYTTAPFKEHRGETDIFRASFGGYGAVNKVLNSSGSQASKNSDTVGGGGLAEIDVARLFGGTHIFRVRAGGLSDRLSGVNQGNVTGEWFPILGFFYQPEELFSHFGYRFDPEVMVQYDTTSDQKTKLLFNGRDESLRVGPQASLIFFSFLENDPFWSRLSARVTFHPYYETVSRRYLSWLQTSATYNFDEEGHIGLTASYKRGAEEDTGKRDNLFKVSLAGKY